MKVIKDLGSRHNGTRNYKWSVFECPKCKKHIERMTHQGINQEQCPECFREYHKRTQTKHGGRYKKLYRTWINMRQRCLNSNSKKYENYGAKGITICTEWNDYIIFEKWANENGFENHLTIDRIDVKGNYTPQNCQWISNKENAGKDKYLNIGKKLKLSVSEETFKSIEFRRNLEKIGKILKELNISDTAYRNAKKRYNNED